MKIRGAGLMMLPFPQRFDERDDFRREAAERAGTGGELNALLPGRRRQMAARADLLPHRSVQSPRGGGVVVYGDPVKGRQVEEDRTPALARAGDRGREPLAPQRSLVADG